MKILLDKVAISGLSVHDADLLSLHLEVPRTGNIDLSLTLELSPEESLGPFNVLGIKNRRIKLIFQDCWQILSNILGFTNAHGVLMNWEIIEASPLAERFIKDGLTRAFRMTHHKLTFSSGSTLELLAERTFIEDASERENPHSG
jgi:hypothetical protein